MICWMCKTREVDPNDHGQVCSHCRQLAEYKDAMAKAHSELLKAAQAKWHTACPKCGKTADGENYHGEYYCSHCDHTFQWKEGRIRCEKCNVELEGASPLMRRPWLCPKCSDVGVKYDGAKTMWSLLPLKPVQSIVEVLQYGAAKYAPDNWKNVPEGRTRYYDAAMRHLTAWWGGEVLDPDSGCHHLAHAGCCILFLLWFEGKQ